jgi:hypothetical protein
MKRHYIFQVLIFLSLLIFLSPLTASAQCTGDFNGDSQVNFSDLLIFAVAYNTTSTDAKYNPACDLNNDDAINFSDLLIFAVNYGQVCSQEEGILEVVSAQIDLEAGGVVEVTDETSEIYGTRFVIDPVSKQRQVSSRGASEIAIILNAMVIGTNELGDSQGWMITPVGVTATEDVLGAITGSLELAYNEDKLSNSGVSKDTTPNVYRVPCAFDPITLLPVPIPGAPWEKVTDEKITHETDKVKIDIGLGDLLYLYTLTVTNCEFHSESKLGTPLPGDLIYRLSKVGVNDNWVPGHVGIYVGERYDEENDQLYNVIEALGSPLGQIGLGPDEVVRTY